MSAWQKSLQALVERDRVAANTPPKPQVPLAQPSQPKNASEALQALINRDAERENSIAQSKAMLVPVAKKLEKEGYEQAMYDLKHGIEPWEREQRDNWNKPKSFFDKWGRQTAGNAKKLVTGLTSGAETFTNIPAYLLKVGSHALGKDWDFTTNAAGDLDKEIDSLTKGYTAPHSDWSASEQGVVELLSSFFGGAGVAKGASKTAQGGINLIKNAPKAPGVLEGVTTGLSKVGEKVLNTINSYSNWLEKGNKLTKTNAAAALAALEVLKKVDPLTDGWHPLVKDAVNLLSTLVAGGVVAGGSKIGKLAKDAVTPGSSVVDRLVLGNAPVDVPLYNAAREVVGTEGTLNLGDVGSSQTQSLLRGAEHHPKVAQKTSTNPVENTIEKLIGDVDGKDPSKQFGASITEKLIGEVGGKDVPTQHGKLIEKAAEDRAKHYQEKFKKEFKDAEVLSEKLAPEGVPVDPTNTNKAVQNLLKKRTENVTPSVKKKFYKSPAGRAVQELLEMGTTPINKNYKPFDFKKAIKGLDEKRTPIQTGFGDGFKIPDKIEPTPTALKKIWDENKLTPGFKNTAFGKELSKVLKDIKKNEKTKVLDEVPFGNAKDFKIRADTLRQMIKNPDLLVNVADAGEIKHLVGAMSADANDALMKLFKEASPENAVKFAKTLKDYSKYAQPGGHKEIINDLHAQATKATGPLWDQYYSDMAGKGNKSHGLLKELIEAGLPESDFRRLNNTVLSRMGTKEGKFSLKKLSDEFNGLNDEQKYKLLEPYPKSVRDQLKSAFEYAKLKDKAVNFKVSSGKIYGASNLLSRDFYINKILTVLTPKNTVKVLNDPNTLKRINDLYKSGNLKDFKGTLSTLEKNPILGGIVTQVIKALSSMK